MPDHLSHRLHIVADLGDDIGWGHASRMLTLAEQWRRKSGPVTIATPVPLPPMLSDRALDAGVVWVDQPPDMSADVCVIDSYRPVSAKRSDLGQPRIVMMLDDHGQRPSHRCELILDQNLGARRDPYPPDTELLLGPSYALVRDEFRNVERDAGSLESVSTVLVTLGGRPPPDLLDSVVRTVRERLPDATVEVAGGSRGNLADLMKQADLAVAAAGSTVWELCAVGTPTVLLIRSDNQVALAEALDAAGAMVASHTRRLGDDLGALAADPPRREQLGQIARSLVDGSGPARVVAALRSRLLSARLASESDANVLHTWANDPTTRKQSFTPAPISWDSHGQWLSSVLADPQRYLVVICDRQEPVGQARLDIRDESATISVSLSPDARGRGLGPAMVRASTTALRRESGWNGAIDAWIKPDNPASIRSFTLVGYVPGQPAPQAADQRLLYRHSHE